MNMNINKKGVTVIETLLALSLLSATTVGTVKGVSEFNKYLSERAMTKDLTTILKAVDTRISIDGYAYNAWPSNATSVTGDANILRFLRRSFIAKTNTECGQADGWVPLLDSEVDRSFISCDFWASGSPFDADVKIETSETANGFLDVFKISLDFPFDPATTSEMERFEQMLSILRKSEENDYANKNGTNSYGFKSKSTGETFTNMECLAAESDCVLEVAWNKQAMYQPLKRDGSNTVIASTISYITNAKIHDEINTCRIWEETASNVWTSEVVECGIGAYSLNNTMVPTTVNVNLGEIGVGGGATVNEKVILDKLCDTYIPDVDSGVTTTGDRSPCGMLLEGNRVVEYVEEQHAKTMRIYDNVYANSIPNASLVEITSELYNNLSDSTAEIKDLNVITKATLKGVVDFTKALTVGVDENNADVLSGLKTATPVATTITDMQTLSEIITINNLNALGVAFNVKESTELSNVSLNQDSSDPNVYKVEVLNQNNAVAFSTDHFIASGNEVINGTCTDKSSITVDKNSGVILTCRNDWQDSSKLTWQSNYYGEISAFDGSCPTGWKEIEDVHSKFLRGSGNYKEPYRSTETLKVGDENGEAFVQLTKDQMPSHDHATPKFDHICNTCHRGVAKEDCPAPYRWYAYQNRCITTQGLSKTRDGSSVFSNDSNRISTYVGGDKKHENRPNFLAVKYCMYAEGDQLSPNVTGVTDPEDWVVCDGSKCSHEVSGWLDDEVKKFYGCGAEWKEYSPEEGLNYTKADCLLDQYKIIKEKEIDLNSGTVRYTGVELRDHRTIGDTSASAHIDDKMTQIWKEISPALTPWTDKDDPYDCSNETMYYDNAKDDYYLKKTCSQDQERMRSRYEEDIRFGDVRPLTTNSWWGPRKEYQTIYVDQYRKVASGGFDGVNPSDLEIVEGDFGTQTILPLTIKLNKAFDEDVLYRITTQDITTTSLLSKTKALVYDDLGNPFISIVDNPNGGRLMFDGGFPKFYNNRVSDWDDMKKFKDLPTQFKFMHNVVKWVGETHKNRNKVLIYGDRSGSETTTSYGVLSRANSGFYYSIPKTVEIAGFKTRVRDHKDYGGVYGIKKAHISLSELNKYSAVVVMSSGGWESLDSETANNFTTYINNGGGVYIITDHDWFQPTGNQILKKFGSEFYGNVNRTGSDPAYRLSNVWSKLSGTEYASGHMLWDGLNSSDSIPAGGSEGNVRVFTPIEDFVAHTEDLLFKAGETEKTINIVINGDDLAEDDETFKIILTSPEDGGLILGQNELIGTIVDDDSGVKSTALSCEGGQLTNGMCFKTLSSVQMTTETLDKEITYQESGELKVRHTSNGDMYLKYSFDHFYGQVTCNDENIKDTLLDVATQTFETGDKKTVVSLVDLIVKKTNSWTSSKTAKAAFTKGALCSGLKHGVDYNFDIKANFKEEVFSTQEGCKEGQRSEGGYCLDTIKYAPIERCVGGYTLDSGYCFKD